MRERDISQNNAAGNMNLNADPRRVRYPDYTDAKNITWNTSGEGRSWVGKDLKGNEFSFEIADVEKSNVIYKVTDDNGSIGTGVGYQIEVVDLNGNTLYNVNTISDWDDFKANVASDLASVATITDNGTNITIEFTDEAYYPYKLENIVGVTSVITQEAKDDWIAGSQKIIGSQPVLDRTYIFSTTVNEIPEEVAFGDGAFTNDGGFMVLDVMIPASMFGKSDFIVRIKGDTGYDGLWMADATASSDGIKLNAPFDAYAGNTAGTISFGYMGYGQIGVLTRRNGEDEYVKLLGSTELNWQTSRQLDCDGQPFTQDKDTIYPTDDYNPPTAFVINRDYVTDGMLTINGGKYEYGNVYYESLVWGINKAKVNVTNQYNSGGVLKSGSYRYTICFEDDTSVESEHTPLTNPIPVWKFAGAQNVDLVVSDDAEVTNKANEITITDIPVGLYKRIVIKCVYYSGKGSVQFITITRQILSNQSSITYIHTGNENSTEASDFGDLLFDIASYQTARNVRIIDNKLIYSNLTAVEIDDLSDYFQENVLHSIKRQDVASGGGYRDAMNQYRYTGYQLNETYRMAALVRLKRTGRLYPYAFWCDDILVDSQATNEAEGTNDSTKRVAGITDHNLTNSAVTSIYAPYIEMQLTNIDYKVNGIPFKDLIEEVYFVRAECVPTILGTGLLVGCIQYDSIIAPSNDYMFVPSTGASGDIIQWNAGLDSGSFTNWGTVPTSFDFDFTVYSSDGYGCLYTGDNIYGNYLLEVEGNTLIYGGLPSITINTVIATPNNDSHYVELTGYTNTDYSDQLDYDIDESYKVVTGGQQQASLYYFSNSLNLAESGIYGTEYWQNYACNLLKISSVYNAIPSLNNAGVMYCYVKNNLVNQYGDVATTKYIHTGSVITNIAEDAVASVFGGDTFTSSVFLKRRGQQDSSSHSELQHGIKFWQQSKINTELRVPLTTTQKFAPKDDKTTWLGTYDREGFLHQDAYDIHGSNAIDYKDAYDPDSPTQSDYPTGIIWSMSNADGSLTDYKRVFPPLNISIEELKDGEIVHHENINGELITVQNQGYKRQYFTGSNQVRTTDGINVNLQSEAMSVASNKITKYGSYHKWACGKGVSQGGKDIMFTLDTGTGLICRHGLDGTTPISERANISEWLKENTVFVHGNDNPAYIAGINFVWDEKNKWAIWVLRGYTITAPVWNAEDSYANGDYVKYNGLIYQWTEDTYSAQRPDLRAVDSAVVWTLIEPDKYYSIVWDENSNGFKCFLSPCPKIFFTLLNDYYSPSYFDEEYKSYKHNSGDYLSWYDGNLEEDGFIEFVDNVEPSELKKYTAIQVESLVVPYIIDFNNESQFSQLTAADFESTKQIHRSPVKSEIVGTGTNEDDTDVMMDTYMKIKFYFEKLVEQRLINVVTKKTILSRSVKNV